jgi:hypothetical protein
MLTQLVDASFSVLGRRFFFGAFLPMAIFLLVVYTLIFGGSAAETFILGFAQQDLAQATFEVVATAAADLGEADREGRAGPLIALDPHVPPALLHDAIHGGEAEAGPQT